LLSRNACVFLSTSLSLISLLLTETREKKKKSSFATIAGPKGVTVNSVNPGYTIPSEMFKDVQEVIPEGTEEDAYEFVCQDVPRRQMVSAWQIAHQVAYFMHPSSGMVTGQKVAVCGGVSIPRFNYLHVDIDRIADMQLDEVE
jgi:enoyl-[acyl-carrier-protein] reductase (NADH)